MMSGFVLRQRNKRPRRDDITVLRPTAEDLKLMEELGKLLPAIEDLLKYCSDRDPLKVRFRSHYVEKRDKVYVYRYLEVEDPYGEVVFRAREGSNLAGQAEALVMLRNTLVKACEALRTIEQNAEFALEQQSKLRFDADPDNKPTIESKVVEDKEVVE